MKKYQISWHDATGFNHTRIEAKNVVEALSICFQKHTYSGEIENVVIILTRKPNERD